MAHKLAIASEHIRADSVEAIEFPHLANKYEVMGVPLTVINERIRVEGAAPEALLVKELMRVLEEEERETEPRDAAWHG